jgi:ribonuclease HII
LLRGRCAVLGAVDEVGRGAIAGPVSVGLVIIDASVPPAPLGVQDSKLLSPRQRDDLVPRIRGWCLAYAVGHASNDEIDSVGIIAALRIAGRRALESVAAAGFEPDLVLLDGSHNWFRAKAVQDLFDDPDDGWEPPPVQTMVKADLTCAAVAAASVLAKVERDGLMCDAAVHHPQYGWEINKGYAAVGHQTALREHGASPLHRVSWNLSALAD